MMSNGIIFFLIKALVSGLIIATITVLAKQFPKWAALLTALPLVTYLSLIWIYVENKDLALLETYTTNVLIWTLPSIAFFLIAIWLFRTRTPFVMTMALATASLFVAVLIFEKIKFLK